MAISKRLETVIKLINLNERVIDIGTDHAYIPIELYKRDITPYITATEVVEGPYKIALDNIKKNDLKDKIRLIMSDWFDKISRRQFDTIVILGMGGSLIANILSPKRTKFAVGKNDKTVTVISMENNQTLYTIKELKAPPISVAFKDEEILITASSIKNPKIELWENGHLLKDWVQTIE